jgi:hypothetical protein
MFPISATPQGGRRDFADDHRRPGASPASRTHALAGDDLELVAAATHEDRLDDAVHPDRLREFLERSLLDLQARLPRVGNDAVEVDLERHAARRSRDGRRSDRRFGRRFGDQGAQATPERRSLLSHTNLTATTR